MPIYTRGAGAHVAERVRVAEGSDDQAHYEELVAGGGWNREEDEVPAAAEGGSGDGRKLPNRTASKADWKAYAIADGMDEAEADKATRDELADRFHGPKG